MARRKLEFQLSEVQKESGALRGRVAELERRPRRSEENWTALETQNAALTEEVMNLKPLQLLP